MDAALVCPSVVGKYTVFLRKKRYITSSPVRNPMTRVTMKVMTTLIATVAEVENKGATVETVRYDCINFGIANNY